MQNTIIQYLKGAGTFWMGVSLILILAGVVAGIIMMKNTKKAAGANQLPLIAAIPLLIGVAMSWLYAYASYASGKHENADANEKSVVGINELSKDISIKSTEVVDRPNWHKFLIARTDYYDVIVITQFADKTKRHIETLVFKNDSKQNPIIREVRIAESLGSEQEWLKYHEGIAEDAKKLASAPNPVRIY